MNALPGFALRHPVAVTMILVSLVLAGILACYRMPLKFLPDLDAPFVGCFIPYAGASPGQVEKEIAIPAEGEFRTIPNLKRIATYSGDDGCRVNMIFEDDTPMATASAEVRDRIERLKLVLPQEVDRILTFRHSSGSIPVMALGFFRGGNEEEFIHLIRTMVEPRLSRLDGVAEVQVFASKPEPEVLIEFDQNRLRTHSVPLYQAIATLQTANINLSVGELPEGGSKYYVRVTDEFRRPEDLGAVFVGNGTRLRDVASVGFKTREMDGHYDIDGKGGAFIIVLKESEANTVDTCENVKAELKQLELDPALKGAEEFVFFDQSELIMAARDGLINEGTGGAAMAVVVLYLFLLRIRPTLIVTTAIPVSMMAALAFMYFWGMTLNLVTMVSLIVAVGMLVDDAIVVIENIYRYVQSGLDYKEAARRGTEEVALAITASMLTTLVVFIPVLYMQRGQMAQFMKQFALPMTAAQIASLFVGFTLIPLAVSRFRDRNVTEFFPTEDTSTIEDDGARKRPWWRRLFFVHPLTHIIRSYARCIDWTLHNRLASCLLVILVLAITFIVPFQKVGVVQVPTLDLREIDLDVTLDQNFDMEMAKGVFDRLKHAVEQQREELGIKNIFTRYNAGGGTVEVHLYETDDPQFANLRFGTQDVLHILAARLPNRIPGAEIRYRVPEAGDENEGSMSISLRMRGDDSYTLNEYAHRFKDLLNRVPNVSDANLDTERAKQEVQLRVDEPLAENAGISPMVIARTVDIALRGNRLPYLKQGGREYPVWAQFREEDRKSRDNLDNVSVIGGDGSLVPLNQLVTYGKAESPMSIQRVDAKNVVNITAKVGSQDMSSVQRNVKALIANFSMPLGYSIQLGDQFHELEMNMANFGMTMMMAIVLIYIVMATLFESFLLPVSILVAVPLAFVGVYWGLFMLGTSLDTIGLIGCIMLVGVVVKNGIVIVDHVNLLRDRGMERHAALVQSGRDRFRPVMMTALTTTLGVVPLAIEGTGGNTVSFVSLGRSLVGGMITGTLLTLVVVPLLYSLIEDGAAWCKAFVGDISSLKS